MFCGGYRGSGPFPLSKCAKHVCLEHSGVESYVFSQPGRSRGAENTSLLRPPGCEVSCFTALSTLRFGPRSRVALAASLGSSGDPRGLPGGPFPIRAVKPGVSDAGMRRSALKMHINWAAPQGPPGAQGTFSRGKIDFRFVARRFPTSISGRFQGFAPCFTVCYGIGSGSLGVPPSTPPGAGGVLGDCIFSGF